MATGHRRPGETHPSCTGDNLVATAHGPGQLDDVVRKEAAAREPVSRSADFGQDHPAGLPDVAREPGGR
ncbi:hypothetical protein [Streptomyces sp. 900105755]